PEHEEDGEEPREHEEREVPARAPQPHSDVNFAPRRSRICSPASAPWKNASSKIGMPLLSELAVSSSPIGPCAFRRASPQMKPGRGRIMACPQRQTSRERTLSAIFG